MIQFVLELEWVLSTGQDKQFAWHCSESGQRLGGYRTSAVASGLQYPLLDTGDLPDPGTESRSSVLQAVSCIAGRFFTD